ncbi:amidohydrolase [Pseudoalteromonas luteoviolacea]|uniref:Amidohydrolase n=1 Tax=Pseudoalteromonas luteoviolacea TaxID=43657 RepID=A0A0C1MLM0_9GAMM|nr:amidohydrolase [Pseudoalteromonas luteoviolacea]KID57964.1 amidohydrolase [Pseudoalteromonas luteoviolacea]
MKKRLLLCLCLFSHCAHAQFTVVHNVNGYTPTRAGGIEQFSTLVIKDGKVVKIGDNETIKQYPQSTTVDGKGLTMLPGLIDAHGHVIGLGENLSRLDLRHAKSVAEVGESLKSYAKENPSGWLIGRGWDQTKWSPNQFPTAHDLDKYVSDRPVVLTRVDGHAIWVNSKAMKLAQVTRQTISPDGGEILRLANRQPSGVFIDKAEQLILRKVPKRTPIQLNGALDKAAKHLLGLGITSVHDAGIDADTWQLYKRRAQQQSMPLRIYAMLSASDPNLEEMLKAGIVKEQTDYLTIRSVKIYADGALGSRGAALLTDYKDRPGHRGLMLEQQPVLESLIRMSVKHGFSAHTHAIGDRANRIVLDSYQSVFKDTGGQLLRNRIEHAQIVDMQDIPRFKQLKIIPSMQPVHATSDMHMAEKRLRNSQLTGAYAWQTFLKHNIKVAAGSDFPVELANPFDGLYAAVTRMDKTQQPKDGWRHSERLTKQQALRAFTLDAAYAAFQEFKLGSLEHGKWADFILIDRDYFTVENTQLHDIKVEQTWIAGKLKYKRD